MDGLKKALQIDPLPRGEKAQKGVEMQGST
jgi:hypothetical protein